MPNLATEIVVPCERGQRTITLRLRFFTDKLAPEGHIIKKHAWACGFVTAVANDAHGIESGHKYMFATLGEIPAAIEKALAAVEVVLHPYSRAKKITGDVRPRWPDDPETVTKAIAIKRLRGAGELDTASVLDAYRSEDDNHAGWDGWFRTIYPHLVPVVWPVVAEVA